MELKYADTEGYVIRLEGGKLEDFYNLGGHLTSSERPHA